jgi:hypothetical protein
MEHRGFGFFFLKKKHKKSFFKKKKKVEFSIELAGAQEGRGLPLPLARRLDASSAHGAALAKVAPWPHARDFFCPTAFDASSAHGAALAQVAPWPHARDFFCSTAFFHCRPFKPVSCANFALGRIWNLPDG